MASATERVWLNKDDPADEYVMSSVSPVPPKLPGSVRVWVDGCFDMMHFGHGNAVRQARLLGTELFVGCHSDAEVSRFKGPPIMREQERYAALRACKWVDYVVENYPYSTRVKDMQRFEIDFVVHGDDVSTDAHGRNTYQEIIDAGLFKVIKRTEGISTTDLVGRMLLCTKSHMLPSEAELMLTPAMLERVTCRYLTTSRKLSQFSNRSTRKDSDTVVYVTGTFDLFHVGHMQVMQKAREMGTYLIVGVHEDAVANQIKGSNYPIMNLNERVLGVLTCRYVDEVVIGAPFIITQQELEFLGVNIVVSGIISDTPAEADFPDPYDLPKKLGIFRTVASEWNVTTDVIIERVIANRAEYVRRQCKKIKTDKETSEGKPEIYRNVQET